MRLRSPIVRERDDDWYDDYDDDDYDVGRSSGWVGRLTKRVMLAIRCELGRRSRGISTPGHRASSYSVIDMNPLIASLDLDESAFTTMLMKLPNRQEHSDHLHISWLEDEMFPYLTRSVLSWMNFEETWDWEGWDTQREKWERERDAALAHIARGMTVSVQVAHGGGAYFRVGDIVRNAKNGEAMRVTAIS